MRIGRVFVLVSMVACGPRVSRVETDTRTASSSSDGASSSPSDPGLTTGLETTSTGGAEASSEDTGVAPRDFPFDAPCSPFEEDCPEGQKCMPWANDGGSTWNATRCSPLAEDPDGVGEACTVVGNGVSGIDSCELHAMCWNVDPETGIGECLAMCTGDPDNPGCDDPDTTCSISSASVLLLCVPRCDPIAQDCSAGKGCYGLDDRFICAPVAADAGGPGDGCEAANACDPGLGCLPAGLVPGCIDTACCTAYCHVLDDETPCLVGQSCVLYFAEGEAPPGYEEVGVCGIAD